MTDRIPSAPAPSLNNSDMNGVWDQLLNTMSDVRTSHTVSCPSWEAIANRLPSADQAAEKHARDRKWGGSGTVTAAKKAGVGGGKAYVVMGVNVT